MGKKRSEKEAAQQPGFEEAMGELEGIVRQLEEGQIGLNEALQQYEKGVKLLRQCYDLLQQAERRIELLSGVDADGKPVCTPLEDVPTALNQEARTQPNRRNEPPDPPKGGPTSEEDIDIDGGANFF